jgi:transmembrane sensor
MTQEEKFRELISKYTEGRATEEEISWLETRYLTWNENDKVNHPIEMLEDMENLMWQNVSRRITHQSQYKKTPVYRKLWLGIGAAAAVILIGTLVLFLNANKGSVNGSTSISNHVKIKPGSQRATLTLANGQRIYLSDVDQGELMEQPGVSIRKDRNGEIVYANIDNDTHAGAGYSEPQYNTLTTARGEQYQVKLPDGSKVWLNAASSLKYPIKFADNVRRVELIGEAYFEISKRKNTSFVVITQSQQVEVLGTHFNICDYGQEGKQVTTLVEGAVKVVNSKSGKANILAPGQQALITALGTEIADVDVEEAIDWKNGHFTFNYETLEEIMLKLSRWYDVDVEFADEELKKQTFLGGISRHKELQEVLGILEKTRTVKFIVKNRTIVVSKPEK